MTSHGTDSIEGHVRHHKAVTKLQLVVKPHSGDTAAPSDVFATKFLPPRARPDLVARPQLLARLSSGLSRKLTLLSAPAGSGKTSLLSQLTATTTGTTVAWLSLDDGDNDLVGFWTRIVAALRQCHSRFGQTPNGLSELRDGHTSNFLVLLSAEATRLKQKTLLVLDDYHAITQAAVHDSLRLFLDHLPSQLHLIISSRRNPLLPLARLRGLGELSEFRMTDLRFNLAETVSFLNECLKLNLNLEDAAKLHARTEGWIAGLQMVGNLIERTEDVHCFVESLSGEHRVIAGYIIEEVLRRQPKAIQKFLMDTAVLDQFCGPLCERVAGLAEGAGQAMLERLETENLFISSDDEKRWYRYSRLFSESMRSTLLRTHELRVPELQRRASRWYAEHSRIPEAIKHGIAAGDFDFAATLIEENAPTLVSQGQLSALTKWVAAIPEDVVCRRPLLCIWHANALVWTGRVDAAESRLLDAERSLKRGNEEVVTSGRIQSGESLKAIDLLDAMRANISAARGDVSTTVLLSKQMLARARRADYWRGAMLITSANAEILAGNMGGATQALAEAIAISQASDTPLNAVHALSKLAAVQALMGRLRQAAETCQEAIRIGSLKGEIMPAASRAVFGLALANYEWNDLESAERHARQGIDVSEGMPSSLILGYGVLARVRQASGDLDGAVRLTERAEEIGLANNLVKDLPWIEAYRVRLWLKQGNLAGAMSWACHMRPVIDNPSQSCRWRQGLTITLARVLMEQGEVADALKLLDHLLAESRLVGWLSRSMKVLALRAVALHAIGDRGGATNSLIEALALGQPENCVRTFVDTGDTIAMLLRQISETRGSRSPISKVSSEYVGSILAAFGLDCSHSDTDFLSARELEVLRLIAAGMRASSIAQELVISLHTAKSHMRNLYEKLGAHTGVEAIARARDMNLLGQQTA